ncbi:hypothetical protein DYB25_000071 [Aphanomyces astaci]|uniref:Protein kinase domain-containing protein n=2 Tax=Aphanomyces astaci TaxID=112090 RepID=A0A397B995_APHAT|nr:hypothetical protein DYB25_000071 [Aphanomyces astaci]
MDRFAIQRPLADALYGRVFLAHDTATGESVAIKQMNVLAAAAHRPVGNTRRGRIAENVAIEKHVNRLLSSHGGHPHVLRMRADFVQDDHDHMVFDYCPGGDLFDALRHGPLLPPVAKRYFRQLIQAVGYIHDKGIAHRDLSLENVLLDHHHNCKVCDFGLATSVGAPVCDETVGKSFYMAPEVVLGHSYDPCKADVMCVASPEDQSFEYFKMNGLHNLISIWGVELEIRVVDLLAHMLEPQPAQRFGLGQVVDHEFIAGRRNMGTYCIDRTLSDALYGEVLLGHDICTDELVAIKKMDPVTAFHGCQCPRVREDIEVEKHVNRLFRSHGGHPNILPMRQDYVQNGADHLVFDFCRKGDLFSAMDHGALPNDVAKRYFHQIALGIAFMHANGVAHRDVSLENVLIDDSDTCRVCDFGLAASTTARCSDKVGTEFYMAPEVAQGLQYDPSIADVWSLGVVLFMMLTGVPLCQLATPSDCRFKYLSQYGLRNLFNSWKMDVNAEATELLELMLEPNPVMRCRLDQVLAHAYLRSVEVDNSVEISTEAPDAFAPAKVILEATKAWAYVNRLWKRPSNDVVMPAIASV